jgi:Mg-chelatase subunit ChlD
MKNLLRAACVIANLAAPFAFAGDAIPKGAPVPVEQKDRPTLEVVFVLDTTSSMGGLIEGAKEKIWSIASRMATGKPTPRIRVGLVAFRDKGDAYVTQRFDLTEDLDTVYKNLHGFRAEGGGDTPEHVGKGLGEAVQLMSWSQDKRTAKMIFLVGDAPPHDDYNDGFDSKTMAKAAIAKGIVVNTIRCGDQADTEASFRAMAKLADGSFDSIGQRGGMVAVATPFDGELAKLNGAVADTSVYAGAARGRAEGESHKAEMKAMAPSASADRLSFRGKSGMGASGGGSIGALDLTAAPEKALKMRDDELPDNLRKMSPPERAAFLKQQAEQRSKLEAQVVEVSKKRDEWISKNVKEEKDSFDGRVFESVKTSAAKAGVAY